MRPYRTGRVRTSRANARLIPASGAMSSWLMSQELAQALRPHMAKAKWEEVVGSQVAAVTQVESVRAGILVVRVQNSVWASELSLLKEDILRRLNLELGGRVITDLHLKGGGLLRVPLQRREVPVEAPSEADLEGVPLAPEALARIAASVQGIREDRLREQIRAALLRVARQEEWKRSHGWLPCPECATLTAPGPRGDLTLCALCHAGIQGES